MRDRRKNLIIAIFSIFFSAAGVLTVCFFAPFLHKSIVEGLSVKIFSVWNLLIFIALSLFVYQLLQRLDRMTGRWKCYDTDIVDKRHSPGSNHWFFWKSFAVIMACWSIWFGLYYPGAGMNDTLNCIITFQNDNQTLVYQLLIYYGIHGLTALTHSMKTAYAVLTVLQMTFMSLVISGVAQWLRRKRIRKKLLLLFVVYYALMPVVADYSITLVKDTLFGTCMMAVIPLIYELVSDSGEPDRCKRLYCAFVVDLLGISVLRSNGKYIALILVIVLVCIGFKRGANAQYNTRSSRGTSLHHGISLYHGRYLLCMLVILLAVNTGIKAGENALIPTDVSFREAIGVPLAQIGAVLTVDGLISEQDRDVLGQLFPAELWKENTRLSLSDPIKFHERFDNQWLNENKQKFINAWFSVLKDNLDVYIKSYLCHTYGFWNISPASALFVSYNQSYFTEVNNNTGDDSFWAEFCADNDLQNREIGHGTVREVLHIVLKAAFAVNMALTSGIMLWLCVWFMTELVICGKYKICCVFLPTVLNWSIMMMAAPSSLIYRYSFYLVLSLPVLFFIMMMQMGTPSGRKLDT